MAIIVDFTKYNKTKLIHHSSANGRSRVKAMVQGEISIFSCDICNESFEVYYDNFPEKCPGCGLTFDWQKSLNR